MIAGRGPVVKLRRCEFSANQAPAAGSKMGEGFRMLSNLRHALRRLGNSPGFTLAALAALALGIGATTAIFTLVDAVLLRSLPVNDPGSLVLLARTHTRRPGASYDISYPLYRDLRDRAGLFADVLAFSNSGANLSAGSGGQPERVTVEMVSGNYFTMLGLEPAAGRLLTPDDDRTPGAHRVAVLSYAYWQRRFGGDASAIGAAIELNGEPFTVVGVAPRGFASMDPSFTPEVRIPIMMQANLRRQLDRRPSLLDVRTSSWLFLIARLRPQTAVAQAAPVADSVYHASLAQMGIPESEHPANHLRMESAANGLPFLREQMSQPLLVLMGVTGFLLLIACSNVAGLLLARAAARQKEIAVRAALGAGRWQLILPLLLENLLLSAGGAILGVWLSASALPALVPLLSRGTPLTLNLSPDLRVLTFTTVVTIFTGLLFGLLPALQFQKTRADLVTAIKGEGSAGTSGVRFRKALVVGQVAVSILLLIGAGLFLRTLRNLKGMDLGFQQESLLMASVAPSLNGYQGPQIRAFYDQVVQRARGLPGVRGASWAQVRMLTGGGNRRSSAVEGYQPKPDEDMQLNLNVVDDRYFDTMGMTLVRGRGFTASDREGAPLVAVVNQTMARYFFQDRDPIGLRFGWSNASPRDIEIIGVVKDTKFRTMREATWRTVYLPLAQQPAPGNMTLHLRATGEPAALVAALRREVQTLDANMPMVGVRSMEEQIDEALRQERLVAWLAGFFSILAALLAAVGLYGVMAHAVALRTREMGIRLALGAQRGHVLGLILGDSARLVALGSLIGVPAALALSQTVGTLLYGVKPSDLLSVAAAAGFLSVVALPAAWLPARRASRVEPAVTLRTE